MSENGGGWPPGPRGAQDPRPFQRPQPFSAPLPGQDGQPPEDRLRPSEYEPVHHEPTYEGPRPDRGWPDDSPWRRTQRLSGPRADGWASGPPANASYGEDPRGPAGDDLGDHYSDQRRYDGGGEYEDEYGAGDRFLPGFGGDGDVEDHDGRPDGGRAGQGRRGKGRRPTARSGGYPGFSSATVAPAPVFQTLLTARPASGRTRLMLQTEYEPPLGVGGRARPAERRDGGCLHEGQRHR